jgi:hypothetical protein
VEIEANAAGQATQENGRTRGAGRALVTVIARDHFWLMVTCQPDQTTGSGQRPVND